MLLFRTPLGPWKTQLNAKKYRWRHARAASKNSTPRSLSNSYGLVIRFNVPCTGWRSKLVMLSAFSPIGGINYSDGVEYGHYSFARLLGPLSGIVCCHRQSTRSDLCLSPMTAVKIPPYSPSTTVLRWSCARFRWVSGFPVKVIEYGHNTNGKSRELPSYCKFFPQNCKFNFCEDPINCSLRKKFWWSERPPFFYDVFAHNCCESLSISVGK